MRFRVIARRYNEAIFGLCHPEQRRRICTGTMCRCFDFAQHDMGRDCFAQHDMGLDCIVPRNDTDKDCFVPRNDGVFFVFQP